MYEVLSVVAQFSIVALTVLTLVVTLLIHLNKKK